MSIPFNKPFTIGNEFEYISDAIKRGKITGNGHYTKLCHEFFCKRYGFQKALLTTSCTDALEMAALLIDLQPGDEVIMPSYTFVSTANAFVLRGAKIVFVDSMNDDPNMDCSAIESLINEKTKAIVPVHYAGVACDMDTIMALAEKHELFVIEDAAQAIESTYKGKPLGSIGHLSAFSFHETKNIISGEGGLLAINDERFKERAEILWEKGTNRAAFFRGEVDKYGWVDMGSSFLPSDMIAAYLYAQLEEIEKIQSKRLKIWHAYHEGLNELAENKKFFLPTIPNEATNNAHMFWLRTNSLEERTALIAHLKNNGVHAVFHYLTLHDSPFYGKRHDGRELPNAEQFMNRLVRLPLYYDLQKEEVEHVIHSIKEFYQS